MSQVFDIWAKRFPRPTDRLVYPIYRDYKKLQKNTLTSYVFAVAADKIDNVDGHLDTSRLKLIKDSKGRLTPIISFRPTFDDVVMTKLEFYYKFFETYNSLCDNIQMEVLRSKHNRQENIKSNYAVEQKSRMHFLIVLTNITIIAMKQNRLTRDHLNFISKYDMKLTDRYNAMIREMGLDTSLSYKFAMKEEGIKFFDFPDAALVGSWFKHETKLINLFSYTSVDSDELTEVEPQKEHSKLTMQADWESFIKDKDGIMQTSSPSLFNLIINLPEAAMVERALELYFRNTTEDDFCFGASSNTNSPTMLQIWHQEHTTIDSLANYLNQISKVNGLKDYFRIDVAQIMSSNSTIEGIRASMMTPVDENVGVIVNSKKLAVILIDRTSSNITIQKRYVVAVTGHTRSKPNEQTPTLNTSLKRISN